MSQTDTVVMTLAAITRADVPAACELLRSLVGARDPDLVICDVSDLEPDLVAVEALARLQLTARRLGCGLRLRGPSRALEQMLALCGLCDVLPIEGEPRLDPPNLAASRRREPSPPRIGRSPKDPP